MAEPIRYIITADSRGFLAETAQVQSRLSGMAQTVGGFASALGVVGVTGGLGFGAITAAIGQSIAALDDLDERAKGLGIAADELSSLEISARAAGVSSEALSAGMGKFATVLDAARNGSKEAQQTVRLLGIDLDGLRNGTITTSEAFRTAADALSGYREGFEKTALARDAFGRGGAAFIAYVNEGAAGLTRFNGASAESIEQAAKLAAEVDQLSAAWERFKLQVAGGFARALLPFQENSTTRADAIKALEQQIAEVERVVAAGGGQGVTIIDQLFGSEERREKAVQQLARLRAQLEGLRSAGDDVQGGRALRTVPQREPDVTAKKVEDTAAAFRRYTDELYRNALAAAQAEQKYIDMENALSDLEWNRYEAGVKKYNAELQSLEDQLYELSGAAEENRKIMLAMALEDAIRKNPEFWTDERKLRAVKGIAGIKDEIEKASDAADRFAMTLTSSLGRLIESGGSMKDFFRALADDIAKLIIQMTILEPLARNLRGLFGSLGAGAGSANPIDSLFKLFSGGLSSSGPSLALASPGVVSAASASRGGAGGVSVTYSIGMVGSGVTRADLISGMEQVRRSTIATIVDQRGRGRMD